MEFHQGRRIVSITVTEQKMRSLIQAKHIVHMDAKKVADRVRTYVDTLIDTAGAKRIVIQTAPGAKPGSVLYTFYLSFPA